MTPGTPTGFCYETASLWQFVGIALLVFKIVIPIILIILGIVDLGKAVISSEDKAISKAAKTLGFRIVAAVVIFFVPTIISAVFLLISAFNTDAKADYDVCRTCITSPNGTKADGSGCADIVG